MSVWLLNFYDTTGGVFEETRRIAEQGRFVAHSDMALFIISINGSGKDWPIRKVAAVTLGKIGDTRAVKLLISALRMKIKRG